MNDELFFLEQPIKKIEKFDFDNRIRYVKLDHGLEMWLADEHVKTQPTKGPIFTRRNPHLLIIDKFYNDPIWVRELALIQDFNEDLKHYKGKRTKERFLFPNLKEEFERLLRVGITDWLNQPANGVFQITGYNDPLVYHSDSQQYAAAIYLTPDAPLGSGTSFWRDKTHGLRRPSTHPLEAYRFTTDAERAKVEKDVYNQHNFVHSDNWELCDRVGAVFNRLVIWDAKMIHSASSYQGLESDSPDKARLVQLFFFNVKS